MGPVTLIVLCPFTASSYIVTLSFPIQSKKINIKFSLCTLEKPQMHLSFFGVRGTLKGLVSQQKSAERFLCS